MDKKILLIEDDLDIQRVYSEKLKSVGYEVFLALDAQQGLSLISQQKFDLIILDIMLPGAMNGFELLEILKRDEKFKDIPVIVLTNLDTEKESALNAGANDYLIKANTSLNEVVQKIQKNIH